MSETMFRGVVSSQPKSDRTWYTVPLSLLIHMVVAACVIVVPLLASRVLPPDVTRPEVPYIAVTVPTPPTAGH